ncbi:MAG: penicillin-binding protein 2 [Candidatus Latescibacterota bacterium]|nr:penicillin-binding protein 2 [Candidatus Latescibacterota bacterium]
MTNYYKELPPQDQRPRLIGLIAFIGLLFIVLIFRLFHLQVNTFDNYARESEANRITQKRVKASRGLILDRHNRVLVRNRPFFTVSLAKTTEKHYQKVKKSFILATGDTSIDGKYDNNLRNIRLKRDVDFRTVSIVEEQLRSQWPALSIETEAQRYYPFGNSAAHLLGYVGLYQSNNNENYIVGDFIGKTGLEKLHENTLRGFDGVRFYEVDASGHVRREFTQRLQAPKSGENLQLTIDIELQQKIERALPDSLSGAVVVLDVRNGAILAMANNPTFDPNIFVSFQSQDDRKKILNSETTLLNRAVRGRYPPGSTLKMIGAIAALEIGITDTLSTFAACVGSLQVGDIVFRCNLRSGHGELSLISALETSCNTYFQHLAQLISIEEWGIWAHKFGIGQPTGFQFTPNEAKGLLPSRSYYQQNGGWTLGHLLNMIIGQGAILVTPLQMARFVAAIANGGYMITPHLSGPAPPSKHIEDLSQHTLKIIRQAMLRVVYGAKGTGKHAAVKGILVAGKTGTAQVPNRINKNNDAWFVGFSPYDNPEIAVAVVIEGGGGGGAVAAPIAQNVFAEYHRINDRLTISRLKRDKPFYQENE